MAMMTREEYVASLDDGRRTFAEGEEIKDLASHPQFATAISLVGEGYEQNYIPGDDASGPYFRIPHSPGELKEILALVKAMEDKWGVKAAPAAVAMAAAPAAGGAAKEEQTEFKDFLDRLRHAKDKEEFDAFMAQHKQRPTPPNDQPSQG